MGYFCMLLANYLCIFLLVVSIPTNPHGSRLRLRKERLVAAGTALGSVSSLGERRDLHALHGGINLCLFGRIEGDRAPLAPAREETGKQVQEDLSSLHACPHTHGYLRRLV